MIIIEHLKLNELMNKTESILREKNYLDDTIQDYKYVWDKFLKMCNLFNVEYFDLNLAKKFLKEYYHIDEEKGKGRLYNRRMRSIYVLYFVDNNLAFGTLHPKLERKIPSEFKDIYNEYSEYLDLNYKKITVANFLVVLSNFFNYLDKKLIKKTDDIKITDIYNFINSIDTNKYSRSSIYNTTYKLKKFFQYLYDNNKFKFDGKTIFPRIQKFDRSHIPSFYTIDEINSILSQVDRSTKTGKRDFAVLILAIEYGLRNSDIINLKFENILWNKDKIELIQYKTKKLLELPLTENVKFVLLDYIKNARPDVDSKYIILPTKPPYSYIRQDAYSSLYKSINNYIKKANIDRKGRKAGLHSLRNSVATNMLKNNIGIPTISQVLGHSSTNVTNIYLSIDVEQLRSLSLEVPLL